MLNARFRRPRRCAVAVSVSVVCLAMLVADTASAAIRSTHVTLDREALARAQAAGSRTLGRGAGPAGLAIVEAPFPFTAIAALTNPGSDGALHIRVSADGLVWSAPTYLPDDEPNPALDERGRAHPFALDRVSSLHFPKLRGGALARFVAFEFQGAVSPPTRVAFHFIDAGTSPATSPRAGGRSQGANLHKDPPVAHPLKPAIILREEWGARPPKYEYTLTLAGHLAVHHTAGVGDGLANSTAECAAQVRGIQAFHQDSRGWNDVGYSYLVCGNGEIFQAREDDDDATDVWGAHDGFNRGSMSVSMMGYFHPPYNQVPSPLQLDALAQTLAWVAEIRQVDPLDESLYEAFGAVRTNIYGHREVRATDCPGNTLFAMKNALRTRVAEILESFRSPAAR